MVVSPEVLHQNLQIAQSFNLSSDREIQELRDRRKPDAADGRYELFKLSLKFPGAGLARNFPLDTQESEVKDMLGAQLAGDYMWMVSNLASSRPHLK